MLPPTPPAPATVFPRKRTNKNEEANEEDDQMDAGVIGKKRVLPRKFVVKFGENGANISERLMYGVSAVASPEAPEDSSAAS